MLEAKESKHTMILHKLGAAEEKTTQVCIWVPGARARRPGSHSALSRRRHREWCLVVLAEVLWCEYVVVGKCAGWCRVLCLGQDEEKVHALGRLAKSLRPQLPAWRSARDCVRASRVAAGPECSFPLFSRAYRDQMSMCSRGGYVVEGLGP